MSLIHSIFGWKFDFEVVLNWIMILLFEDNQCVSAAVVNIIIIIVVVWGKGTSFIKSWSR